MANNRIQSAYEISIRDFPAHKIHKSNKYKFAYFYKISTGKFFFFNPQTHQSQILIYVPSRYKGSWLSTAFSLIYTIPTIDPGESSECFPLVFFLFFFSFRDLSSPSRLVDQTKALESVLIFMGVSIQSFLSLRRVALGMAMVPSPPYYFSYGWKKRIDRFMPFWKQCLQPLLEFELGRFHFSCQ